MPKILRYAFPVLVLVAAVLLPVFNDNEGVLTTTLVMFIIAALASSWNIIGGFAGQVNLGHAAFFGIGALVTRLMWLQWVPDLVEMNAETGANVLGLAPLAVFLMSVPWLHVVVSFVMGGLAAVIAALILGYPGLRLKGIYFSIGTLALAEAIRITVGNIYPRVSALPGPELRNYALPPRYYLALLVLVICVLVSIYLKHSKLGLGMMATREDEDAARAIGVNIFAHKLVAFVISAGLAGLAGGSFGFFHVSYYPSLAFGPTWTFDAIIVTFIGGVGTIAGPLIGAAFFVLVRDVLASELVDIHLIIFGALFILVVLLLPGGLFEGWEQLQVWRRNVFRSLQGSRDQAS